jgi:hypothetical protein
MEKIKPLIDKYFRVCADFESITDKVQENLFDIIGALGMYTTNQSIESVYFTGDFLVVYTVSWCGGEREPHRHEIPKCVWSADDPIAAANEYRQAEQERNAIKNREKLVREIQDIENVLKNKKAQLDK